MKQNISTQYSSNDFLILEDRAIYFAKNNDYIDCMEIARIADIENIYISWFGLLLTGSKESSNNPLFFGELDSKGEFIESKPINSNNINLDSNSIESKANNTESNPIHNTQPDNNNIESKTNNAESNNQESKLTLDSLYSSNTQIFLYSHLLLGSSEIESNPLFFGKLDKEGVFRESKPVYYLIGEIDYDSKDSKESFTQTLQVSLDSNTLTLLNYSLLDSSLNIKLESNSKESKIIQEREKTKRTTKARFYTTRFSS